MAGLIIKDVWTGYRLKVIGFRSNNKPLDIKWCYFIDINQVIDICLPFFYIVSKNTFLLEQYTCCTPLYALHIACLLCKGSKREEKHVSLSFDPDPKDYFSISDPQASVQSRCVVQTTDWSPCSSSCGMGLSSRVTNDNAQCKLERETRLCNIRPCSPLAAVPKVFFILS